MSGLQKIYAKLQSMYFNLLGALSGLLYTYRSAELNTAIGGSRRSQHVEGRALDLDADVYGGCTNSQVFNWIKENVEFDQLIWEFGDDDNPDWVHVSYVYDGINRKRCLKACRDDNGKTYYEVIFGKGL
jgi:hypothetical protein